MNRWVSSPKEGTCLNYSPISLCIWHKLVSKTAKPKETQAVVFSILLFLPFPFWQLARLPPLTRYVSGNLAVLATRQLQAWLKARPAEDLVGRFLQHDSPPCCAVHQCCLGSNQPIGGKASVSVRCGDDLISHVDLQQWLTDCELLGAIWISGKAVCSVTVPWFCLWLKQSGLSSQCLAVGEAIVLFWLPSDSFS